MDQREANTDLIFRQIATERDCQSYLIDCRSNGTAITVDPEASLLVPSLAVAAKEGLRIHYVLDTHTLPTTFPEPAH